MTSGADDTVAPTRTEFREPEQFDYSSFACPRCAAAMSGDEYRPCDACMAELKASQRGEGGDVEVAAYEPKMNVTPNAVALKDD